VQVDEFGTEFPHGAGRVAKRELAAIGYTRYSHLAKARAADLLKIHGVGPRAIRILREELAARGLAFAHD
jgi:predicted flap endonuclease-1-like 5' DNA nuclease